MTWTVTGMATFPDRWFSFVPLVLDVEDNYNLTNLPSLCLRITWGSWGRDKVSILKFVSCKECNYGTFFLNGLRVLGTDKANIVWISWELLWNLFNLAQTLPMYKKVALWFFEFAGAWSMVPFFSEIIGCLLIWNKCFQESCMWLL